MNRTHGKPLNRSITIGCVSFIVVLCVVLSIANLSLYRSFVYGDYQNYLTELLGYVSSHIDGDDLETCIETGKESESYRETLLFMDDLLNHFDDIHYLYAVKPLNTEARGNVMSVLSAERYEDRYENTEGNLYLGWISDDEFDSKSASRFFDIMKSDGVSFFEEKTEWGIDYTGAIPIKNSKGEGIAVLAVDIDLSFINTMILEDAMVNIGLILLLGLLFIGAFLHWSHSNITQPIRDLEKSAAKFAERSHGQRDVKELSFKAPEIKSDNEIKALSNAIVKMTENMKDYVLEIASAEEKAANMQELAIRDALTGVRNKVGYDREIKHAQEKISAGETKVGIALLDLNFLKRINDTYGHDKGNITIKKFCDVVCETFKHSGVFRIGGDEFVVLLNGPDYEKFNERAESLNAQFAQMAEDETLEPWEKVSAAIGVAFYNEELDDSLDDLFRRADHVMYERKKEMKALRTG